ncbi:MAG TPA: flagellar biosynthesis protein FlhF [Burkholderiaceae bacterium]|nr:flagellar biosynthesis protein FlhF [Burkholderiaceae bacterium]
MNVKRFAARTSRDALALVRQAFGVDAVVLSTKPCNEGIEVLAMAADSVAGIERMHASAPQVVSRESRRAAPSASASTPSVSAERVALAAAQRELAARVAPEPSEVEQDATQLAMSTLSFQDYVRERMLKRRHAELHAAPMDEQSALEAEAPAQEIPEPAPRRAPAAAQPAATAASRRADHARAMVDAPVLHEDPYADSPIQVSAPVAASPSQRPSRSASDIDMMSELRSMKGLIEERFGALAFMEKLQRQPRQAMLAQKLLDAGFSPALIRKMVDALPATAPDESAWAAGVLERNLQTNDAEAALEDMGGVFALIGSTGVGKTTSCAKIAAGFAARHGAANLGLVTLDAYRVGAQEQLRTYGRILGVPVHTAHDRASLEDLLELLAGKKMVLIDTAGMAQRDHRTRELLEMLSHRSIKRLLVVDASSQGETIDDVIVSWKARACSGVVLSKIDEAVKLAPALDALIRHKLKNIGVANGQRVPEDWHRLSANALVHRAMKGGGSSAYRMDPQGVHLVFAHAGVNSQAAASLHV